MIIQQVTKGGEFAGSNRKTYANRNGPYEVH